MGDPVVASADDLRKFAPVVTVVGGRAMYDPQGMLSDER
jgi:hypothetical protein